MSEDKELQIRFQFLEEAEEYLDNIESGLLGLGEGEVNSQEIDGVLRAAHSIKGGAAMMGFQELSQFAHRLEDFFKILKVRTAESASSEVESLFLSSVDLLRQIVTFDRQKIPIDPLWLEQKVNPIFVKLQEHLGEVRPEDSASLLSEDMEEDMASIIFQTEVEELLEKLETNLENSELVNLSEELLMAAEELSGLGEMLELNSFTNLCQSVIKKLEIVPDDVVTIARSALQEWRRSQALVLVGQSELIPNSVTTLDEGNLVDIDLSPESNEEFLDSLLDENNLEEEALSILDSIEDILPQEPEIEPIVINSTTQEDSPIISKIPTQPAKEESPLQQKTIRVALKQLETLTDLFGEIAIEKNGLNLQLQSLRSLVSLLVQRIKSLEDSNFKLRIAYDKVATETTPLTVKTPVLTSSPRSGLTSLTQPEFDSLEMDNYSEIHTLSQEVMETIVQLHEVTQDIEINLEDTEKNSRQLNRTTKQMQSTITKVRMRPMKDLLDRFPRALRNLEIEHDKKVELKIRGGSTLIDRSVLEALNDPLMHLFRNAFDHGIEETQTRISLGKPQRGCINIVAVHRGNKTVITISDDGGGINLAKIKKKALSLGFSHEDLNNASDEELLNLIFEPGFSTAEKVTDLSGRGVGMDVVKTNIEDIKGKIKVDTKLGIGTTFTISVPFTLSIVRVLLVESNGMLLAFPTNIIEEMIVLEPDTILQSTGQEILNWDGVIIPLIRLHDWLVLPHSNTRNNLATSATINQPTVLMVARGENLVGIQVDRYWQEQEVTIRPVEGNITLPPGFTGCTILGDGSVVPLVDAISLLDWIENNGTSSPSSSLINKPSLQLNSPSFSERKTIMTIDDSINVRRFLALTLEKANYHVEQAKDGQDAIDKLKSGIFPNAIICDIEMPRIDGFGFLCHVQSNPKYKKIPVIMLTSRTGEKHRQLAINLGASEYFSKPFKENKLLATLKELIL